LPGFTGVIDPAPYATGVPGTHNLAACNLQLHKRSNVNGSAVIRYSSLAIRNLFLVSRDFVTGVNDKHPLNPGNGFNFYASNGTNRNNAANLLFLKLLL
jgi:hypothetical protein